MRSSIKRAKPKSLISRHSTPRWGEEEDEEEEEEEKREESQSSIEIVFDEEYYDLEHDHHHKHVPLTAPFEHVEQYLDEKEKNVEQYQDEKEAGWESYEEDIMETIHSRRLQRGASDGSDSNSKRWETYEDDFGETAHFRKQQSCDDESSSKRWEDYEKEDFAATIHTRQLPPGCSSASSDDDDDDDDGSSGYTNYDPKYSYDREQHRPLAQENKDDKSGGNCNDRCIKYGIVMFVMLLLAGAVVLVVLKMNQKQEKEGETLAPAGCNEPFQAAKDLYYVWMEANASEPDSTNWVWSLAFQDAYNSLQSNPPNNNTANTSPATLEDPCAPILVNATLIQQVQQQQQLSSRAQQRFLQSQRETANNSTTAPTTGPHPILVIAAVRVQGRETPSHNNLTSTLQSDSFRQELQEVLQQQQTSVTSLAVVRVRVSPSSASAAVGMNLALLLPPTCSQEVLAMCHQSVPLEALAIPGTNTSPGTKQYCSLAVADACNWKDGQSSPNKTTSNTTTTNTLWTDCWTPWRTDWGACTETVRETCRQSAGFYFGTNNNSALLGNSTEEHSPSNTDDDNLFNSTLGVLEEEEGPGQTSSPDDLDNNTSGDRFAIQCGKELRICKTLPSTAACTEAVLTACNYIGALTSVDRFCADNLQSRFCWPDFLSNDQKRIKGMPLWRLSWKTCLASLEERCGLALETPRTLECNNDTIPCSAEPATCSRMAEHWMESEEKDQGASLWPTERLTQRFAMAVLYCEWNGDHWPNNTLWFAKGHHECDWLNDAEDACSPQQTIQIIRPIANMQGTLPSELALLTDLKELNLYNSSITGTIPTEYKELTQLNTLVLGENSLQGPLPDFVWEYQEMVHLDLSNNHHLSGTLPDKLNLFSPKLQELDLGNNKFSGSLDLDFAFLDLKTLDLRNNSFAGTIPPDFNAAFLEYLYLHDNQLEGEFPVPMLSNEAAPNLIGLTLYNNNLEGDINAICDLFKTGNLEFIHVDSDKVACTCCGNGTN